MPTPPPSPEHADQVSPPPGGDRELHELLEHADRELHELLEQVAHDEQATMSELLSDEHEQDLRAVLMQVTADDRAAAGALADHAPVSWVHLGETPEPELLVSAWLTQYAPGGATRDAYARDLRSWLSYCEQRGWDAVQAHRVQVQAWVTALHEKYAPSTVSRRLTAVRSWYAWLQDELHLPVSPAARVRLLVPVPTRSPSAGLELDEAQQLLAGTVHLSKRDALAVGLLLMLGLRASELGQLRADELRHERGHLVLTVRGKGGTVHELPVHAWLGDRAEQYLQGRRTGWLLETETGEPMTRYQVRRLVERACRWAGVRPVSPHQLRHAAVTLALQAGAPLHRVQDLARHASPVTTRRYDDAAGRLDGHAGYELAGALVGAA